MANKLFHFNGVQAILTDIGISYKAANTIASASQAVDDFHEDKLIVFEDGALFYPVVTAHKMLDPDNLDSRDASNIWMPFHFFPNSDGYIAALKTIEILQRENVLKAIWEKGKFFMQSLCSIMAACNTGAVLSGIPPMFYITFKKDEKKVYREKRREF